MRNNAVIDDKVTDFGDELVWHNSQVFEHLAKCYANTLGESGTSKDPHSTHPFPQLHRL